MSDFDNLTDEELAEHAWNRMRVLDPRDPAYSGPECSYCAAPLTFEEATEGAGVCDECAHEIDMEAHASLEGAAR